MSTPFGLEHHRDHPVVDRDGNPVTDDDPTLLPRDPDGTEADASAEAEYRAGSQTPPPPAEPVAQPIVLPGSPDSGEDVPSHRKDTPVDATPDDDRVVIQDDAGLVTTPARPDAAADVPPPAPDAPPVAAAPEEAPRKVDDANWLELQGKFVDDPQAAVREAADLLDQAIADLRRDLQSTDSTEDLRHAFRRYRDVYRSLR